tara:strand:+ start:707 stop:4855 length:4149 start_codon:yes stop_codon:yes gene_type:complete
MTDQDSRSKNKGLLVALLMILTAASPITGSAQADHDTDSDGNFSGTTVKIGFLGDSTGPISDFWDGFWIAANIATDHLNEEAHDYDTGVQFEIVPADSGCSESTAASGAQDLVDAGVAIVVGALCSGASMGANSVLSAAGVPHISPTSSAPALSDSTAYPGFFRVISSDGLQGQALAEAVAGLSTPGTNYSDPAILHMSNDQGSGSADSFEDAWTAMGNSVCTSAEYDPYGTTDYSPLAQSAIDAGCDSVVMFSYSQDGVQILEELDSLGFSGQIFGSEGVSNLNENDFSSPEAADGVITMRWSEFTHSSERYDLFSEICANYTECDTGIYVEETYDAVSIAGEAALLALATPSLSFEDSIRYVGYEWDGASSLITFNEDGDVAGSGFDVYEYEYHSGNSTLSDWFQYYWAADFSFEPDSDLYGVDVFEHYLMSGREVVDIAFLYDMSGPISMYSLGFEASAEIAMDYMNSEQDEYWYNVVGFDTGCDATVSAEAAQDAIDEGIELVIGPLCSGASMAANSVLSAAGVPHISPTSSAPALSDSTAYPGFFRVIPSDGLSGVGIAQYMGEGGAGMSSPALVYVNDYGYLSGISGIFEDAWEEAGNDLCMDSDGDEMKFEFAETGNDPDYTNIALDIVDADCDSVVLVTYTDHGADMVEELVDRGFDHENGVIVSPASMEGAQAGDFETPSHADELTVLLPVWDHWPSSFTGDSAMHDDFWEQCDSNTECSSMGIFQAQAFDAISIVAQAHMLSEMFDVPIEDSIRYIGFQWEGASSEITFDENGDSYGSGHEICDYYYYESNGTLSLECDGYLPPSDIDFEPDSDLYGYDVFQWSLEDFEDSVQFEVSLEEVDIEGETVTIAISRDVVLDASIREEIDIDFGDGDGVLSLQEGDLFAELVIEGYGLVPHWVCFSMTSEDMQTMDHSNSEDCEGAGGFWAGPYGFLSIDDEDGDGSPDSGPPLEGGTSGCSWNGIEGNAFEYVTLNGIDPWCVDGIVMAWDFGEDENASWETEPMISWVWFGTFNASVDPTDGNFTLSYPGDSEDGSYQYPPDTNLCTSSYTQGEDNEEFWQASVTTHDADWGPCIPISGFIEEVEITFASTDSDGDSYKDPYDSFPDDSSEWFDSDGDGVGDNSDAFPTDANESADSDGDGVGDNSDALPTDANETVDSDGDGVGDNSDTDVDGDGVDNDFDEFPTDSSEGADTDSDGIGDNQDTDDDNDGVEDTEDAFPLDPSESSDIDGDGIGDNADDDDDGDGWLDATEVACANAGGSGDKDSHGEKPSDLDGDGLCDAADLDDDGDGYPDPACVNTGIGTPSKVAYVECAVGDEDRFPLDNTEWFDEDGDMSGDNANPPEEDDLVPGFGALSAVIATLLGLAVSRRRTD